ncbi:MAG: hypothetical protein LBK40_08325 [Spirochaetaceae bacterium]|jgi:hypothetical protein|nr:hypothetical protein [Spirochaetaceae bacterium]
MKKTLLKLAAAFAALAVLAIVGCSNPSGDSKDPVVTSVTVTGGYCVPGGTIQVNATVNGTGSPSQAVTWEVSGGSSSISESGLLSVAAGETDGTVLTVTATSQYDTGKTGAAAITVVPASGIFVIRPTSNVETVGTPSATFYGSGAAFTVTNNGTIDNTVTWSLSGNSNAGTTIGSTSGVLSVHSEDHGKSLTITANGGSGVIFTDTVTAVAYLPSACYGTWTGTGTFSNGATRTIAANNFAYDKSTSPTAAYTIANPTWSAITQAAASSEIGYSLPNSDYYDGYKLSGSVSGATGWPADGNWEGVVKAGAFFLKKDDPAIALIMDSGNQAFTFAKQ